MSSNPGIINIYEGGFAYSSHPSAHPRKPGTAGKPGRTRGDTETFTAKSKKNFLSQLRQIGFQSYLGQTQFDFEARAFFFTLDLPQDHEPTLESFRKMKDALYRQLFNYFGSASSAIWKAERQKKTGTAHLHIIFFADKIHQRLKVAYWLQGAWCRICRDYQPDFQAYGSDVETIYEPLGLGKYLAKDHITQEQTWRLGAIWGTWGKKNLPTKTEASIRIDEDDYWTLQQFTDFLKIHPLMPQTRKVSNLSPAWDGFGFGLPPGHALQIYNDFLACQAGTWAPLTPERQPTHATASCTSGAGTLAAVLQPVSGQSANHATDTDSQQQRPGTTPGDQGTEEAAETIWHPDPYSNGNLQVPPGTW